MTLTFPSPAHLLAIQQAALRAADPARAVSSALRWDIPGKRLRVGDTVWDLLPGGRLALLAVGKAAVTMAQAVAEVLGESLTAGLVITKTGHTHGVKLPACLEVREASHPIPGADGYAAAQAAAHLLDGLTEVDHVLVLISGGASALLPFPAEGIGLNDLQVTTNLLLRAGAVIGEINAVRKHLDGLKGGQMVRRAAPAALAALILSDVVGDPLDVIASGPTVPDPTTYADALAALDRYGLRDRIPASVRLRLEHGVGGGLPETPKPGDPLFAGTSRQVIASNRAAALAAAEEARRLGYATLLLTSSLEGEAREVGKMLAALAKEEVCYGAPLPLPACLVLGGETTVTVRGNGMGGRNQELALSAALALEGVCGAAVLSLATDGTDGPTDCAGAVVNGETIRMARALDLDPVAALANNDSYPLLKATGALIFTGPTGTNVNDVMVVLVREDGKER